MDESNLAHEESWDECEARRDEYAAANACPTDCAQCAKLQQSRADRGPQPPHTSQKMDSDASSLAIESAIEMQRLAAEWEGNAEAWEAAIRPPDGALTGRAANVAARMSARAYRRCAEQLRALLPVVVLAFALASCACPGISGDEACALAHDVTPALQAADDGGNGCDDEQRAAGLAPGCAWQGAPACDPEALSRCLDALAGALTCEDAIAATAGLDCASACMAAK